MVIAEILPAVIVATTCRLPLIPSPGTLTTTLVPVYTPSTIVDAGVVGVGATVGVGVTTVGVGVGVTVTVTVGVGVGAIVGVGVGGTTVGVGVGVGAAVGDVVGDGELETAVAPGVAQIRTKPPSKQAPLSV